MWLGTQQEIKIEINNIILTTIEAISYQYKKKKKFKNPYKKEDHHVSSNQHGGIKSKEISKKKIIRQVWVPKSIIEDIISISSKRNKKGLRPYGFQSLS